MQRSQSKHERREFQLSERASEMVNKLAEAHGCNFSDAIEGLLFCNIDQRVAAAMAEHRLSESEARIYVEMRQ